MQPIEPTHQTKKASPFRTISPLFVDVMDEKKPTPVSPTTEFNLKPDGEVQYSGEVVSPESKEVIQDLLRQSEYYRLKAHQLEQEKLDRQRKNDAVVVIFSACVVSLLIFVCYAIISTIIVSQQPSSTPDIKETPDNVQ